MAAITKATIDAMIDNVQYYRFPGTCITMCCITLVNGHAVTGESSCSDPADFDVELGQQHSKRRALDKVYEVAAFQVREAAMLANEFQMSNAESDISSRFKGGKGIDHQAAGACPEHATPVAPIHFPPSKILELRELVADANGEYIHCETFGALKVLWSLHEELDPTTTKSRFLSLTGQPWTPELWFAVTELLNKYK